LLGFPAPAGPAHHVTNPYDEDLAYLMGGERIPDDIGYFPRLKRQMIFTASGAGGIEAGCERAGPGTRTRPKAHVGKSASCAEFATREASFDDFRQLV
jgi:hypothetical protein